MMNGDCFFGDWGSLLGNFGVWGWIGLILTLVIQVGAIVGITLLVIWVIRRARVSAIAVPSAGGQPTALEILQAQYARGDITREQYELKKQVIG